MNPYLQLLRFDRPIGIWLLFFPAAWGVLLSPTLLKPWLLMAMLAGAVITRAAGCIINDLTDRRLDRQVERTRNRPLANGTVPAWQAFLLLAALLVAALLLAFSLPRQVVVLSLLASPMIAAYPWMKRFTWWPQLFLGFTFNFGALIGWAATGVGLAMPAYTLYAACIFWTLGYDTIYALQDRADDAAIGIKSTARALVGQMRPAVAACYIAMLALLTASFVRAGAPMLAYFGILGAGVQAAWQLAQLDETKPERAGALFRSNQWLGFVVLAALLLGRVGA